MLRRGTVKTDGTLATATMALDYTPCAWGIMTQKGSRRVKNVPESFTSNMVPLSMNTKETMDNT
jgi:hypothetical protein